MFVYRTADESPLTEQPLELIEREIEALASEITAGHARWLELVREFDRREGWGGTGCRSTSEWVAWRCSLNPRSAREHVRVARALGALPRTSELFASGGLSYSKVRAVTRIAEPESEADLIKLATHATAAQLERIVRAARRVSAQEAAEVERTAFVRFSWDAEDGMLEVHAKLAPADGALVIEALEAARESIAAVRAQELAEEHELRGSAEPRLDDDAPLPPQPSNAECLTAIAELALARPPSGFDAPRGGERHQLLVHVDADHAHLARGPGIAQETARRIACDASLVPLVERDGRPVAIGARKRTVPASVRRALLARDESCAFPGCERHRFVDAHHIAHWADGGATSLGNLTLLCRHHHRLVHEHGFSVERDNTGGLVFRSPSGEPLPPAPAPPRARGVRRRAAAPLRVGAGDRMDLGACVDAALAARRPSRSPGDSDRADARDRREAPAPGR